MDILILSLEILVQLDLVVLSEMEDTLIGDRTYSTLIGDRFVELDVAATLTGDTHILIGEDVYK